ncbi:uncharacterized protein LOC129582612 isoform X2 [Paramacrobiotus metropolitanus]|uniref:uncharacterized protein LOC129582612 isoform X2 n=1 Tax=Paramacrobiotus metropolitanus TaxID=2943436 RepID=UPI002445BC20|nr:uncharacterized protein LOC129582612 isoform X2 [Paramacrobiotus metropolitanus]XP_055330137.1 uncharacterized protein LOC129582612 isoform X2 [Paramacrobiotus metropolitanus]
MEDDRALLKVPSARKAVRAQPAASEKRYFNSRVMVKGNWTREEDALLVQLVQDARSAGHAETDPDASGPRVTHWAEIAKNLPGRVGKQCRERWHNNLRPDLKKGEWSLAEEVMIFSCWRVWGPQWAKISRALEGRSDNRVKNHWNCHMKRRLEKDNEYVAVVTKTVEALDLVSALRDIMNVENSEKAFKDLISPQIVDYLRTNHHNELDSRTSSYVPRSTYVSRANGTNPAIPEENLHG